MIPRLVALWFTMIVMGFSSSLLFLIAENHYYHLCSLHGRPAGTDLAFLPLISRIFINLEGWIYYYPSFFIAGAAWMSWKRRDKSEEVWSLIVISPGTKILFTSAFYVAVELPSHMGSVRVMAP
ncbi:hypothetical protein N9Y81_03540 [Akkermansiaceae bacterium]|jgi:hypothetical protein|nr:hypothetical protein [Akkermansiaceae bacterium]